MTKKAASTAAISTPPPPKKGRKRARPSAAEVVERLERSPLARKRAVKLIDTAAPDFKPPPTPPPAAPPPPPIGDRQPGSTAAVGDGIAPPESAMRDPLAIHGEGVLPPAATMPAAPAVPPPAPKEKAMPDDQPLSPSTLATVAEPVPPEQAPRRQSVFAAMDAIAPPPSRDTLRLHVRNGGQRGRMVDEFAEGSSPDEILTKARMTGEGDYELCAMRDGNYTADNRRFKVTAAEAEAYKVHAPPAAVAPPGQGAAPDVRGLVEGFGATVEKMMAGMMAMVKEQQSNAAIERREAAVAAKEQQLELIREMRGSGGGGGNSSEFMEKLALRALEPPPPPPSMFDQLSQFLKLQRMISSGGEENGLVEGLKAVAPALTGLIAAASKPAPAAAPSPVRVKAVRAAAPPAPAVVPGESSTAAPGDEGLPTDAPQTDFERFKAVLAHIERFARKQLAPDAVLVALDALLEPEEFAGLQQMASDPAGIDQLLMFAPQLAEHREWLELVAVELRADPGPAPEDAGGGA